LHLLPGLSLLPFQLCFKFFPPSCGLGRPPITSESFTSSGTSCVPYSRYSPLMLRPSPYLFLGCSSPTSPQAPPPTSPKPSNNQLWRRWRRLCFVPLESPYPSPPPDSLVPCSLGRAVSSSIAALPSFPTSLGLFPPHADVLSVAPEYPMSCSVPLPVPVCRSVHHASP